MSDICPVTGAYLRNSLLGHCYDAPLAEAIAIVLKKYDIKSIYDFGCGHGNYTKFLKTDGFSCSGFDGNPYTKNITHGLCDVLNLAEPFQLEKVDCVLCLEVGEHIPKRYEDILLTNIKNNCSNLLILSWGIEGQPGEGHVNCRNNDYIKNKLTILGFSCIPEEDVFLRERSTFPWFKNTIMVFKKIND